MVNACRLRLYHDPIDYREHSVHTQNTGSSEPASVQQRSDNDHTARKIGKSYEQSSDPERTITRHHSAPTQVSTSRDNDNEQNQTHTDAHPDTVHNLPLTDTVNTPPNATLAKPIPSEAHGQRHPVVKASPTNEDKSLPVNSDEVKVSPNDDNTPRVLTPEEKTNRPPLIPADHIYYPIDKILKTKIRDGTRQFYVQWTDNSRSWQPQTNLSDYSIREYFSAHTKTGKARRRKGRKFLHTTQV